MILICSFSSSMYRVIVLKRQRFSRVTRSLSLSVSPKKVLMWCKAKTHKPIVGNCWELRSLVARSNGLSSWLNIFNNVESVDVNSSWSNFSDCLRERPMSNFSSNSFVTTSLRAMKLSIMCKVEFHLVQTSAVSIRRIPNWEDSFSKKDLIKEERLIIEH